MLASISSGTQDSLHQLSTSQSKMVVLIPTITLALNPTEKDNIGTFAKTFQKLYILPLLRPFRSYTYYRYLYDIDHDQNIVTLQHLGSRYARKYQLGNHVPNLYSKILLVNKNKLKLGKNHQSLTQYIHEHPSLHMEHTDFHPQTSNSKVASKYCTQLQAQDVQGCSFLSIKL